MANKQPFSLDVIQIPDPCTEDWASMQGDQRKRFCAKCQLHVHNLSAMPTDEAREVMESQTGRVCVRIEPAATAPMRLPERWRIAWTNSARPMWRRVAAVAGLAFVGLLGMTLGGCEKQPVSMGVPMPPPEARADGVTSPPPATPPAPAPTPPTEKQPTAMMGGRPGRKSP